MRAHLLGAAAEEALEGAPHRGAPHAVGPEVVVEHARRAGVRQNVGVPLVQQLRGEWPVLLRGACTPGAARVS